MFLTVVILLPLAVAGLLLALPRLSGRAVSGIWMAAASVDLALIGWMWWRYEPGEGASGVVGGIAYEVDVRWIPVVATTSSMTRWRSSLDCPTMRHSRSP